MSDHIAEADYYSFKKMPTLDAIASGDPRLVWLEKDKIQYVLFQEIEYGFALALDRKAEWLEQRSRRQEVR